MFPLLPILEALDLLDMQLLSLEIIGKLLSLTRKIGVQLRKMEFKGIPTAGEVNLVLYYIAQKEQVRLSIKPQQVMQKDKLTDHK